MIRFPILLLLPALFACTERAGPGAKDAAPVAVAPSPGAVAALPDFTELVRATGPAVVNVVTTPKGVAGAPGRPLPPAPNDPYFDFYEFFRRFIPNPPEGAPPPGGQGIGSGFIISEDGYVLTNAHVVAGSEHVTVRLADSKREFKAKVVGYDTRTDVALLKVEAKGLPTVKIGDSEKLQVGDWVAAIGSPFGFDNTVTAGIVSAKGRQLPDEYFVPFIQTDVAVNPGNSGGPLLNLSGEAVGVNSMIYSGTGGYMGLSFAIPINVAMDIANQLKTTGRVTRGLLGVGVQTVTPELAQSFGLQRPIGAIVARVQPGSPAAKAGLQAGDVILRSNKEEIDDATELTRLVATTKPGTVANVQVWRQGAARQLNVTIGEMPTETAQAQQPPPVAQKSNRLGLSVSPLPPERRKALGVNFGLVVQGIEPDVDAPRLDRGDVIVAVNGNEFSSLEEFQRIIDRQKPGSHVALLVRRGDAALFVPVKVKG